VPFTVRVPVFEELEVVLPVVDEVVPAVVLLVVLLAEEVVLVEVVPVVLVVPVVVVVLDGELESFLQLIRYTIPARNKVARKPKRTCDDLNFI
jgi:hypothetical protein